MPMEKKRVMLSQYSMQPCLFFWIYHVPCLLASFMLLHSLMLSNVPVVPEVWSNMIFHSFTSCYLNRYLKSLSFWRILHWRLLHEYKKRWHYFIGKFQAHCMPTCGTIKLKCHYAAYQAIWHIMQHNYRCETRIIIFCGMHWCELTDIGPYLIILLPGYVKGRSNQTEFLFCIRHKLRRAWFGSTHISPQNVLTMMPGHRLHFFFPQLNSRKSCSLCGSNEVVCLTWSRRPCWYWPS